MVEPVTPGSSDAALDGLPGPTHCPTPSGISEQDQETFVTGWGHQQLCSGNTNTENDTEQRGPVAWCRKGRRSREGRFCWTSRQGLEAPPALLPLGRVLVQAIFSPLSLHHTAPHAVAVSPQCLLQRAAFPMTLASAGRRASVLAPAGGPGLRAPVARPGRGLAGVAAMSFLCPSGLSRRLSGFAVLSSPV